MVSGTVNPSTNPNSKNSKSKKVYHIGGVQVEFPYQPYGTQLAFMGRVISTLDRAQRDGHCHALLESPTGTGKSLSLLCSTLAWQQNFKLKHRNDNLTQSKPNPEAIADPLGHGGGFIPETQPSSIPPSGIKDPGQSTSGKNTKKKTAPTIYYSSRTHSQLTQVIREFRKTAYRVPMTVLASRKHYCTNPHVSRRENIDEECKLLLKDRDGGCSQFKNVHKVKAHPTLQKGGCHEVHDIEDLVKVGKNVKGCAYYAARSMAADAHIAFCPYNYIINPVIRGAMEVDIKGSIIILDEAHNIEDAAREAGSVDIDEDNLYKLQMELGQLCELDALVYPPLYEMAQDLLSWIGRRKDTLQKHEFQNYVSCWTGDEALMELQEANISKQCFPILMECALKAIKAATDPENGDVTHLSGMSVIVLEGLFSSLNYFFSRNGSHVTDFQLALRRSMKRDRKNPSGNWTQTFSLWCLNPAVVFRDIAELSLSVILTSGTLSPMNSFSSELGVQFGTTLEAPHVVDTESQVWAAVISNGPNHYPLNASYKTADEYAFQDELGKTLEGVCMIVPAGSLVFFPSYKLMEKLCDRWRETGQWSRLNARKTLFVEPRGGMQEEDFDSVLKGYYDTICPPKTPVVGRKRMVKKWNFKATESQLTDSTENSMKDGAAFLAVCRGKVSEGMDFSDDNARVVIVVGIPFPNLYDIQVGLKKKYNDAYKTSKNLLNGHEWYSQQAFRALNQAIGRCIRHRFDYGAIILLDERYKKEQNRMHISKWIRKSIHQYDDYNMSLEGLKSFFRDVKENVSKKMVDLVPDSDKNEGENMFAENPVKGFTRSKKQRLGISDILGVKTAPSRKCKETSPVIMPPDNHRQASMQTIHINSPSKIVDLECDSPKDSRCIKACSLEDPEVTIVKETPAIHCNGTAASPSSFANDGNCSSTMIQASAELTDHMSSYSVSLTSTCKTQSSVMVTPIKNTTSNTQSMIPEESTPNLSVNSHQKKRKSFGLFKGLPDSPNAQTPGSDSSIRNTIADNDLNRRIEFSSATKTDQKFQICCSMCKSSLGLPENQLYVSCTITSSSKVHLMSLVKERLEHCTENTSTCIPVLMTDASLVNQRLCNNVCQKYNPGRGIWREEDGCVFNSICCPFCSTYNCLGVQIMATDASNVQLLNKILLYLDRLEIQNTEASVDKAPTQKVSPSIYDGLENTGASVDKLPTQKVSPSIYDRLEIQNTQASVDKVPMQKDPVVPKPTMDNRLAALSAIEKFSYCPSPTQNSGGWRTTKSKLSLPKKGQLLNGQSQKS